MAAGFLLTSVYFLFASLVGTLSVKLWYDKGSAANKLHMLLVNTAVICCYLIWAIVWMAQWHPLVVPILKAEGE
ncbi:V-type H+-transporting ATPase subunit e [Marchantia polymorpha subsp. ruderalis]|uniref:Uncharacterized protein n=2 Tax=Marchantia polymorpha TaxID=3197 RepID=A0AAF6BKM0_MARPO|nr:hypothetical protein MARPO_0058s0087 [Marchantia polymorpha]BBN12554.1 hypothetical protein Mp_5g21060 [Marchantia polymorpha subsp. ruderalis]|eukprot:PTQ37312.1 hypothetical protein MARPO_0058s0087 [Marchantia polymorpha]